MRADRLRQKGVTWEGVTTKALSPSRLNLQGQPVVRKRRGMHRRGDGHVMRRVPSILHPTRPSARPACPSHIPLPSLPSLPLAPPPPFPPPPSPHPLHTLPQPPNPENGLSFAFLPNPATPAPSLRPHSSPPPIPALSTPFHSLQTRGAAHPVPPLPHPCLCSPPLPSTPTLLSPFRSLQTPAAARASHQGPPRAHRSHHFAPASPPSPPFPPSPPRRRRSPPAPPQAPAGPSYHSRSGPAVSAGTSLGAT